MQKVQFFFHNKNPFLRERKRIKFFIEELFAKEKKNLGTISYIFCSDEDLLVINREFLNHDFYTDTITFDLSSSPKEIEGEVYISIDRVRENAKQTKTQPNEELLRVAFHGALHLCGYNDKKKKDKDLMRNREEKYLELYFNKRTFVAKK